MKRNIIKTIILFVIFAIGIFIIPSIVNANEITKIDKLVKIDNNGDAKIIEIWNADMDKDTEIYLPYDNLEDSEFKNLTVTDDRGITYETVSNWNPKASFEDKKNKCGINKTQKGIELCWGISEYGEREYKISYDLTNFVVQSSDYQYTYMCLFPKMSNLPIKNMTIKIKGIEEFSTDNIEFWCYGNSGKINIEDGLIVFDSNGKFFSGEYMTTLIKYKTNVYNTLSTDKRNFEEIKTLAMKGTSYSEFKQEQMMKIVIALVLFISFLPVLVIILGSIKKALTKSKSIFKKPKGKKIKNIKKIPYEREIPCNGDIKRICHILKLFDMLKDESSLLGAYILQWKKNGYIDIRKNEKQKNSVEVYFLNKTIPTEDIIELRLWKMLLKAAGMSGMGDFEKKMLRFAQKFVKDKQQIDNVIAENEKGKLILETNEFNRFCSRNYSEVLQIFYDFNKNENDKLIQEKLIIKGFKTFKILLKRYNIYSTIYTEKLQEEAERILGFKKFLLDYSLIAERESIEVELWEQYLIIAEVLGIADKVEKQFESVYTKYKDLRYMSEQEDLYLTKRFYNRFLDTAKKSKKSAESTSSSSSRDSGKGGSSYRGGGSGARGSSSSSGGTR